MYISAPGFAKEQETIIEEGTSKIAFEVPSFYVNETAKRGGCDYYKVFFFGV
jgi:hypothetical protein